jgi:hypothetical protein
MDLPASAAREARRQDTIASGRQKQDVVPRVEAVCQKWEDQNV